MPRDYYQTLGVPKSASEKDVRAAFRRLARRYHPDVNRADTGAEKKFKEINDAYHVLSNSERRRNYDQFGDQWQHADRLKQTHYPGTPFTRFSQGSGPRRTVGNNVGTGFGGVNDLFRDLFGGGQRSAFGSRTSTRIPQTNIAATISLEEAYDGTSRLVTLPNDEPNGAINKTLDVLIPAGVDTGSRVHIKTSSRNSKPLDVFLRITVSNHSQFERHGNDIRTKVRVPVTLAVLGGEVEVPRIRGNPLALLIPPESQNGKTFRLKGQGMPIGATAGAGRFGDMLVIVELELPSSITDQERNLFKELRDLRAEQH